MSVFMVYKGNVYLPKTIVNATHKTTIVPTVVESGDFKDYLYYAYSDRSAITNILMRDSIKSANVYKLINTKADSMSGVLISPIGDIHHLVFLKKTNKPLRIVGSTTLPIESILNEAMFARTSGLGLEADSINHLMVNNDSLENIFKYLATANMSIDDFNVYDFKHWKEIYNEIKHTCQDLNHG